MLRELTLRSNKSEISSVIIDNAPEKSDSKSNSDSIHSEAVL